MITIREVSSRKQRREFIRFPLKLYRGNPYFVPALYGDEKRLFKKNCHYNEISESVYFLAYDEAGKVVGRIHGILHLTANEKWRQRRVRFTRFDAIDDQRVADALFAALESWAKTRGMTEIVGPLGFSDLEREGLLIEGFDQLSTFEEQYNFPYYQKLIENCGYTKEVDWLEHRLSLPDEPDERLDRVADKIMKRYNLHVAEAKNTGEYLKLYAGKFFDILDKTYAEIYGTIPFTEAMKKDLIKSFRQILDLRFIRLILDEKGDPVCFGLCFPSIGCALQKSGGRLTIPTLFKILHAVKKPEIIDLGLIGVTAEYRNKGVTALLISEIMNLLKHEGVKFMETNLNLEDNYAILNYWKVFNSVQHKRRRSFVKEI